MKIMAIDYGDAHRHRRFRLLTLAGFTTVITAYRPEAFAAEVKISSPEHGVTGGARPPTEYGRHARGRRQKRPEGFAALLRETTGLPSRFGTSGATVDAHNILGRRQGRKAAQKDGGRRSRETA